MAGVRNGTLSLPGSNIGQTKTHGFIWNKKTGNTFHYSVVKGRIKKSSEY